MGIRQFLKKSGDHGQLANPSGNTGSLMGGVDARMRKSFSDMNAINDHKAFLRSADEKTLSANRRVPMAASPGGTALRDSPVGAYTPARPPAGQQ